MKHKFLILFSTLFSALLFQKLEAQSNADLPNIIFIMADDLGYADLECYGGKMIKTPHIDQMASEGMKFTQFYANSVCAPTRYSLMTGKHSGNAYVRGNHEIGAWKSYMGQLPIPKEEVTFFEILKQKNYATATYGKWAMGHAASTGAPHLHGVDDFFGYNCQRHAHSYYPHYLEGNEGEKHWLEGNNRDTGQFYSHDLLTEKAINFIQEKKDTNFLLYLPYTIPHTAFQVPDWDIYKDKDWPKDMKTQAAMITRMDRDIGRIFQLLKDLNIDDNTIVFFTSDNGAHGEGETFDFFNPSGELRGMKRDLYEGGIRVPMIVRWPGKIQPNTVSDHIGALWDVLPTFAELTNSSIPVKIDGLSFLPELLGQPQKDHHHLYWEFHEQGGKQAVRKGKWKAVRLDLHKHYHDAPVELYNLEEDLSETTNIAHQHPDIAADLLALMKTNHSFSEHFFFKSELK